MKKSYLLLITLILLVFISGITGWVIHEVKEDYSCSSEIKSDSIEIKTLNDRNYFPAVLDLIRNAKNRIDLIMFTFKFYENNNSKTMQIANELISAKKRGVKVRVIVDDSEFLDNVASDNAKMAGYLQTYGIEVRMDDRRKTLHSKVWIIDDYVVLGSHNLVYYALEHNNEASIVVKSEALAEEYENYFEFLWKK